MPTTLPRTYITHTPQVQRALEVARRRWPNESRDSALIANLLEVGQRNTAEEMNDPLAQLIAEGKAAPPKNRQPGRNRRTIDIDPSIDIFAELAAERRRR